MLDYVAAVAVPTTDTVMPGQAPLPVWVRPRIPYMQRPGLSCVQGTGDLSTIESRITTPRLFDHVGYQPEFQRLRLTVANSARHTAIPRGILMPANTDNS